VTRESSPAGGGQLNTWTACQGEEGALRRRRDRAASARFYSWPMAIRAFKPVEVELHSTLAPNRRRTRTIALDDDTPTPNPMRKAAGRPKPNRAEKYQEAGSPDMA